MNVKVGSMYRHTGANDEEYVLQVLRIAPGAIPVFDGFADLEIGVVSGGYFVGKTFPFGTLERFADVMEEVPR